MYISNGTTVDAAWTKSIAYSPDGINWSTLHKGNLTVKSNIVNKNINSPLVRKATSYIITILDADNQSLQFELSEIKNQGTWVSTPAGLQVAVDDITIWIAS